MNENELPGAGAMDEWAAEGKRALAAAAWGSPANAPRSIEAHSTAQEAAAERQRQLRLLFKGSRAMKEYLQREGELAARVDELQATLTEVLGHFTQQGHPGEPCLRAGWIGVKQVDRWRRIAAGRPSWDQLFALIDVELNDEQREMLRLMWTYRETHGMWPLMLQRRQNGRKTVQAAAAELLERARAAGWAE